MNSPIVHAKPDDDTIYPKLMGEAKIGSIVILNDDCAFKNCDRWDVVTKAVAKGSNSIKE